ncbi:hypothetical protein [Ekhidna sp.]
MGTSFLYLEYSGWWVLLILIFAAALSYFLYVKKNVPWNKTQNLILASIRFLAISSILLLLLSPSIRKVTNTFVKPLITIAFDNSQSIPARGDSQENLSTNLIELAEKLKKNDLEVVTISHDDSTTFSAPTTNLSSLIKKVELEAQDKNHVGMILISDGIYNRGYSPLYKNYLVPVFTIGMGDTIPPKDISISRTRYNKVTFKGNETPIQLEITQDGYQDQEVNIQLREKNILIAEQKIRLKNNLQEVVFNVKSGEEGLRYIVASVTSVSGESTYENNRSNIFMEVIDGRQRVLIVANAPHPDIKSIRSSLAETGNYQTEVYIPEIHKEKPNEVFDVVIFHGAFTSGVTYTPKENPGIWYILSNESSITSVNKTLPYIEIERRGSRPDKIVGSFNQSFSKFKIENAEAFEEYPPIEVPFGNYNLTGPTEVLMYQKLGSIKTQKPLMAVFDDGTQKSAILFGQNIWKWKLQEAAITENTTNFSSLITKTVQFLTVKNDKKQFRFNVRQSNFSNTEPVIFDSEVYNDIYERIYDNDITINISKEGDEFKTFNFTDSEYNTTFTSPTFSAGIYRYEATVTIGATELKDVGEFSVQNINPEYLNLTADHRMLKNLASKTGGFHTHFNSIENLAEEIESRDFKSIIKSEEDLSPLHQAWWWYFIILFLFSTEWVLRKYWGGY